MDGSYDLARTDRNAIGRKVLMETCAGFPGAGRCKVLTYSGAGWTDTQAQPDGSGTFDFATVPANSTIGIVGGPEGAVFIPAGNPQFTNPGILVASLPRSAWPISGGKRRSATSSAG